MLVDELGAEVPRMSEGQWGDMWLGATSLAWCQFDKSVKMI